MYEMITGRRAFKRDSAAQTMAAIIEAEPEPIAALSPETPDRARDGRRAMSGQRSGASLRVDTRPRARSARSPRHVAGIAHVALRAAPPGVAGVDGAGSPLPARSSLAVAVALTALESRERAAGAGARAARPVRQAGERRSGDRRSSPRSSPGPSDPVAHTLLAEAYWRKFEYTRTTRRSPIAPAKRRASRSRAINRTRPLTSCWP